MAAAVDTFANHSARNVDITASAGNGAIVTPSDSVDLPYVTREIRNGGAAAGDIKVTTAGGQGIAPATYVIPNVQVGEKLARRVTRIWATGTTATVVEAVW